MFHHPTRLLHPMGVPTHSCGDPEKQMSLRATEGSVAISYLHVENYLQ